jgi:hypothetical protein
MALSKTFTLPEGYSASYLRLVRIDRLDHAARECVAFFSLYKDATTAATAAATPIRPVGGTLILRGAKFDQYVGKTAIKGPPVLDVSAQLYVAAKAEPMEMWHGTVTLSDATDA